MSALAWGYRRPRSATAGPQASRYGLRLLVSSALGELVAAAPELPPGSLQSMLRKNLARYGDGLMGGTAISDSTSCLRRIIRQSLSLAIAGITVACSPPSAPRFPALEYSPQEFQKERHQADY